jgi:hypothetical protein
MAAISSSTSADTISSMGSLSETLLQSARAAQGTAGTRGLLSSTAAGLVLGVPASVTLTLGQAAAGPARGIAQRHQVSC